jgi:hypothetical protein
MESSGVIISPYVVLEDIERRVTGDGNQIASI